MQIGCAPAPLPAQVARRWWAGSFTGSTLLRFAGVGGLANLGYVALFLSLTSGGADVQIANAVASLASAGLANELHRRFTFSAASRVPWYRAQWAGTAAALGGVLVSGAALAVLHLVVPDPSRTTSMVVSMALTAVTGLVRFVVLRATLTESTPSLSIESRFSRQGNNIGAAGPSVPRHRFAGGRRQAESRSTVLRPNRGGLDGQPTPGAQCAGDR